MSRKTIFTEEQKSILLQARLSLVMLLDPTANPDTGIHIHYEEYNRIQNMIAEIESLLGY